jgi:hypothetical protein
MSQPSKHRPAAPLSAKTEKNLFTYAAAAGAAGVSLLALSQPSEAKIIYTPTHQLINPVSLLNIDVNNDGVNDFTIHNQFYTFGAGRIRNTGSLLSYGGLLASAAQVTSNKVVGKSPFASALASRFRIGASDHFIGSTGGVPPVMELCERSTFSTRVDNGYWPEAKNKYLGLKFSINGQTHFGWARLSVKRTGCKITAVLTGYAYETVANKSIQAGKTSGPTEAADLITPVTATVPTTLGALAQGSPALAIWRREEETGRRN